MQFWYGKSLTQNACLILTRLAILSKAMTENMTIGKHKNMRKNFRRNFDRFPESKLALLVSHFSSANTNTDGNTNTDMVTIQIQT